MNKIAFIGIGVMGESMARHLMKSGYALNIYTRTKAKATRLIEEGAHWYDSVNACIKGCEVIITMVGYPKDIEEVYFGEEGIINGADKGAYLIDMTTTSPELAIRISKEGSQRGLHVLDAPVSGGDSGAKAGTLTIMVGGLEEDFITCKPILEKMGSHIVYEGEAGMGQHTKMANQIAISGTITSVCEALSYAKAVGLNPDKVLDSISKGAAGSWQMTNMAPKILKGQLEPGFYMKHFIKDMKIAKEEARKSGLELKVLEEVLALYESLEDKGYGDLGTQAMIKYYE